MDIDPSRYYCYLPGSWILTLVRGDDGDGNERIFDGLIETLKVPGKPAHLRRLSRQQKFDLILQAIEHHRATPSSLWYRVEAAEVLAAHFHSLKMSAGARAVLFSSVKRESDLAAPVVAWMEGNGLQAHLEVATGTKRPDVIGHGSRGLLGRDHVVAVELKNDIEQLKRGLDQMTTFAEYAHETYLACTPALAAEYLFKHANARTVKHWDPRVLDSKLEQFGFGLLLVAGTTGISVVRKPRSRTPRQEKLKELLETLRGRTSAARSRK